MTEAELLNDYYLGRLNAEGVEYYGDSAFEYWKGRCDTVMSMDGHQLECGEGSKRCGNACIPRWKKCRASWNKPVKLAAGAAVLTGAALAGTAFFHPRSEMRKAAREAANPVVHGGFALSKLASGNIPGAAKSSVNAATSGEKVGENVRTLAKGYGKDLNNFYKKGKKLVTNKR